jgi:hypothetical protein
VCLSTLTQRNKSLCAYIAGLHALRRWLRSPPGQKPPPNMRGSKKHIGHCVPQNCPPEQVLTCMRCLICCRYLLKGVAPSQQKLQHAADQFVHQLQVCMAQAGAPALSSRQLAAARATLTSLVQCGGSVGSRELQEACRQLSISLGLSLTPEQISAMLESEQGSSTCALKDAEVEGRTSAGGAKGRNARAAASASPQQPISAAVGEVEELPEASRRSRSGSSSLAAKAAPARGRRAGAAKAVSFKVEEPQEPPLQQQEQQPARAQRAAARVSKAAVASAEPVAICSPPTGDSAAEVPGGLCEVFGAMSLEQQEQAEKPAAATTARASKHRSR